MQSLWCALSCLNPTCRSIELFSARCVTAPDETTLAWPNTSRVSVFGVLHASLLNSLALAPWETHGVRNGKEYVSVSPGSSASSTSAMPFTSLEAEFLKRPLVADHSVLVAGTMAYECVSDEALAHLKTYKYSGVDKSYVSHYILRHYVR